MSDQFSLIAVVCNDAHLSDHLFRLCDIMKDNARPNQVRIQKRPRLQMKSPISSMRTI